jgi:prepilin-type N-terminal cleavage/methylation domain-containing protein
MISRRSSGFSLIELIIVLIIVGFLILLVTPTLTKSLHHMELKSAVKRTSAILRMCRSDAVNKRKVYLVDFDTESNLVGVLSADKGEDKPKAEKSYPLPREIQMEKIDVGKTLFDVSLPTFEFYLNGGSNGGTATFRGRDGGGYSIEVDGLTGTVKIRGVEKGRY